MAETWEGVYASLCVVAGIIIILPYSGKIIPLRPISADAREFPGWLSGIVDWSREYCGRPIAGRKPTYRERSDEVSEQTVWGRMARVRDAYRTPLPNLPLIRGLQMIYARLIES